MVGAAVVSIMVGDAVGDLVGRFFSGSHGQRVLLFVPEPAYRGSTQAALTAFAAVFLDSVFAATAVTFILVTLVLAENAAASIWPDASCVTCVARTFETWFNVPMLAARSTGFLPAATSLLKAATEVLTASLTLAADVDMAPRAATSGTLMLGSAFLASAMAAFAMVRTSADFERSTFTTTATWPTGVGDGVAMGVGDGVSPAAGTGVGAGVGTGAARVGSAVTTFFGYGRCEGLCEVEATDQSALRGATEPALFAGCTGERVLEHVQNPVHLRKHSSMFRATGLRGRDTGLELRERVDLCEVEVEAEGGLEDLLGAGSAVHLVFLFHFGFRELEGHGRENGHHLVVRHVLEIQRRVQERALVDAESLLARGRELPVAHFVRVHTTRVAVHALARLVGGANHRGRIRPGARVRYCAAS